MAMRIDLIERIEQFFSDTQLPCQGSMSGHSVIAVIDLGDSHRQQFFQAWLNGSRTHNGFQQLHAVLHNLRPVSHGTKEGRHRARWHDVYRGQLYVLVRWYA